MSNNKYKCPKKEWSKMTDQQKQIYNAFVHKTILKMKRLPKGFLKNELMTVTHEQAMLFIPRIERLTVLALLGARTQGKKKK